MKNLEKLVGMLEKTIKESDLQDEKLSSRKITNKLELKSVISPNKIFKLFQRYLIVPDEEKTIFTSMFNSYSNHDRRIINSILLSFEFNKERHHKFPYIPSSEKSDKKNPIIYLREHPILENLSTLEINNIRAIIIIMQNENCFNNFNPLLASKIIANNFYCAEKNSNNSIANNRKIFDNHFIAGSKNSSKYTPISSKVKLHEIKQYLK